MTREEAQEIFNNYNELKETQEERGQIVPKPLLQKWMRAKVLLDSFDNPQETKKGYMKNGIEYNCK
jgi:cell fate (sporulation/competence/biofilm development) regulator YlbF (YheA/YmcA/DUF963 family)